MLLITWQDNNYVSPFLDIHITPLTGKVNGGNSIEKIKFIEDSMDHKNLPGTQLKVSKVNHGLKHN